MNPLDAYDALVEEERRALREYHKARAARLAARKAISDRIDGSKWDVSVVVNETQPAAAAPTA